MKKNITLFFLASLLGINMLHCAPKELGKREKNSVLPTTIGQELEPVQRSHWYSHHAVNLFVLTTFVVMIYLYIKLVLQPHADHRVGLLDSCLASNGPLIDLSGCSAISYENETARQCLARFLTSMHMDPERIARIIASLHESAVKRSAGRLYRA